MSAEIKILLVDDHAILREGVKNLLDSRDRFRVVASVGSAEEALQTLENRTIDVVVTDISLPKQDGVWLVGEIKARKPDVPVLVLSISSNRQDVLGALQAGASGYLTKVADAAELEKAILAAYAGQSYLQPTISSQVLNALRAPVERPIVDSFTEREREVIELVYEGLANKQIASRLCVSVSTIKGQLRSIFQKLDVNTRTELVVKALKVGLLKEHS